MKTVLTILFIVILALSLGTIWISPVIADPGDTLWTRTYGGGEGDEATSVQQTADGGYIIAGYTESLGDYEFYLVKTNASGDSLWTRTYGGDYGDYGECVRQTTDGGYIITGETWSYGAGMFDIYLVKTDEDGDTLWTRTYGGNNVDYGVCVQQTTDGGYIIAGYTDSFGAGGGDFYLVKTNASGDTLWTRTYGSSVEDEASSVQQTADGGYIIAGTISFGTDFCIIYLVKTDDSGDTLWTRIYGASDWNRGNFAQLTTEGGYIIGGHTYLPDYNNWDVYLIKTDSSGDTSWTCAYGGSGDEWGFSVEQTTDGGYIIAGSTDSFGAGRQDVYLVKTSPSGDTQWTRAYGGINGDWGFSVEQTTDGGYIIAGSTTSFGSGGVDIYLVKIEGELVDLSDDDPDNVPKDFALISNYPNPFNTTTTIEYQLSHESNVTLDVFNLRGQKIATLVNRNISAGKHLVNFKAASLSSGIYFYRLTAGDETSVKRMTLLK